MSLLVRCKENPETFILYVAFLKDESLDGLLTCVLFCTLPSGKNIGFWISSSSNTWPLMSSKNKYREILLITGKGLHSTSDEDTYVSSDLSKLRHSIPEFISSDDGLKNYIISIEEAEKKDGGDGAILIKLKNL